MVHNNVQYKGNGNMQEAKEFQYQQRTRAFIAAIPKSVVTREEYDQMVLVVNQLVEKVNELSPSVPPPPQKK